MSDWEMLDTVPKDGTRVLFYIPAQYLVDARPEDGVILSGWYDSVLDDFQMDGGFCIEPTHWRPLPKPPLVESAQQT